MSEVFDYTQLALISPDSVEITLRVGIVNSGDHLQAQVEVREASTKELLSMVSHTHFALTDKAAMLAWCFQSLEEDVERYAMPL